LSTATVGMILALRWLKSVEVSLASEFCEAVSSVSES
jgi:hypothetical protein